MIFSRQFHSRVSPRATRFLLFILGLAPTVSPYLAPAGTTLPVRQTSLVASARDVSLIENRIENPDFELGRSGWLFNSRPMGASFLAVPREDAPSGRMVARVEVGSACNVASLGSRWMDLEEGRDYVFSISLRTERGSLPVTLSVWSWADAQGRWNTRTQSRKQVMVTEEWQRFFVTANLGKARGGKYQALIEMRQPGILYADAAQLEEGNHPSDFPPGAQMAFGIDFSEPTMLFEHGEEVAFIARVLNRMDQPQEALLSYTVSGFYGETVHSGSVALNAVPGLLEETIRLPLEQKGYYKLKASVACGKGRLIGEQRASFAVIEHNPSTGVNKKSPFGISISPNNLELELQRAKAIGAEHIRVHEVFSWRHTEVERGEFRWSNKEDAGEEHDSGLPALFNTQAVYDYSIYSQSGMDPLIYIFCYKNGYPSWAAEYSNEQKLEGYGDYYKALAGHYKGVFENIEVINEPWGHMDARQYLDVLKATHAKAKEGNPDAVMVGVTAYHGPQINFLKELIDLGGLDYMDVLSLHPYPRPESPEPSLIDFIQLTKQWMEDAGKALPLWITEMGWTTRGFELLPTRIPRPEHRHNTDTEQAQYLVRSMILSIANGVELLHWFHFSGDHTWRYTYHMFECDSFSSPMKTIPAFSAMSRLLADAEFKRTLSEGEGSLYAYLFRDGDRRILPAWTVCSGSTLFLQTGAGQFDVVDTMGNRLTTIHTDGGVSAVDVTGSVVYLVATGDVLDSAEVLNVLSLDIESPATDGDGYAARVSVSNGQDHAMTVDFELELPRGVTIDGLESKPVALNPGEAWSREFDLMIQRPVDSLTEYITLTARIDIQGERHTLRVRDQLRYVKPLPKPTGGIWIEAEKPDQISFEPSPAWLPNQFRSHGGDQLRFRGSNTRKEGEEAFVAEYVFTVDRAGDYTVMMAGSSFGECSGKEHNPALRWKINGSDFRSCCDSREVGRRWAYETHKNVWWRFRNVWHDMGTVRLERGTHRLLLQFGTPPSADYSYLAMDAIVILDGKQSLEFQNQLNQ